MTTSLWKNGLVRTVRVLLVVIGSWESAFCELAMSADKISPSDLVYVGVAETDITPPDGFPIAGYFHERLAQGQLDPLKAKAIVFRGNDQQVALVLCDLAGIAVDLTYEVRKVASARTGIPSDRIVLAATHSHTSPEYYKTLYNYLRGNKSDLLRATYIEKLIDGIATAAEKASQSASPTNLEFGSVEQQIPVSFNRRFVMKDGSVQTWMNYSNPNVIRAAGPIDSQIGLLLVKGTDNQTKGLLSNFALHLDTVGGMKWSGDYPYYIERAVRSVLGESAVSLFGNGCCGDINHVNPRATERNKTDMIGTAIGSSIQSGLKNLSPIKSPRLEVRSAVVPLSLQSATSEEVAWSVGIMKKVQSNEKVDFFDHVTAHKRLLIDRMKNKPSFSTSEEQTSLLFTHSWAGIGDSLPVEVHAICLSEDLAIVTLPGEVFVELGLAIKQGSPFHTTIVIELAGSVETCYIPTRAAYAGGGYEVTNSAVAPGSGEALVEAALTLLRSAAKTIQSQK